MLNSSKSFGQPHYGCEHEFMDDCLKLLNFALLEGQSWRSHWEVDVGVDEKCF